jgi:hypothetical protein
MATKEEIEFLYDLERLLIQRKKDLPKGSYSTRLFKKGIDKIAQKLGEEARGNHYRFQKQKRFRSGQRNCRSSTTCSYSLWNAVSRSIL